jgi:hypothetical protein
VWCLGAVPVVPWGIEGMVFFLTKLAHLSIPKWRQKERETLLLGLSAGLILSMFFSSTLLCDRDGMAG